MRILSVLSLGVGLMVSTACSAPDPGVPNFGSPKHDTSAGGTSGGSTTGGTTTGGTTTGGSTTTTDPGADAGTTSGTDAGGGTTTGVTDAGSAADSAPAPATAFTGAGAFASKPVDPAASAKQLHLNNNVGIVPDATQNCLGCHGAAAQTPFLAAGTVFTDKAGTSPAADYEVRVVDAKGAAFSAHTDPDGNFRIDPPMGGTTGPYTIGVRNATTVALMTTKPADNSCNNTTCHAAKSTQGTVHVP